MEMRWFVHGYTKPWSKGLSDNIIGERDFDFLKYI